jgi:transcriptional regulator NrdR family protein
MKCPTCGVWTTVKETRMSPTYGQIRRRECANEHRFTTKEVVIPDEEILEARRQRILDNASKGGKALAVHKSKRKNFGITA